MRLRNFILLTAIFVCFANCRDKISIPALPQLPDKAGPLPRTNIVSGTTAAKFMYRMHGKITGTRSSIIGYYGTDKKNVLYLSSFENLESAEKALFRMAAKIKKGPAEFTPPVAQQTQKGIVFQTSGMGLKHFFYRSGRFLVWWQAEPDKAEKTFSDLYTFKYGE